jgi:hemerythrin
MHYYTFLSNPLRGNYMIWKMKITFCLCYVLSMKTILAQTVPKLITVGAKTTVVTAPVDQFGYPDYRRALNEVLKKRLGNAPNVAIDILKATGPGAIEADLRKPLYDELGLQLPEKIEKRFQTYEEFLEQYDEEQLLKFYEEHQHLPAKAKAIAEKIIAEKNSDCFRDVHESLEYYCSEHAWTAKEFPLFGRYHQQQASVIQDLMILREREKYYAPGLMIDDKNYLIAAKYPLNYKMRLLSFLLQSHVQYQLGKQDYEAAWQSAVIIARLRNYLLQQPNALSQLMSNNVDAIFADSLKWILIHNFKVEQLNAWETQLKTLNEPINYIEGVDLGERYLHLSSVCYIASQIEQGKDVNLGLLKLFNKTGSKDAFDFDEILTHVNAKYDQLIAMSKAKDFEKQYDDFCKDVSNRSDGAKEKIESKWSVLMNKEQRTIALRDRLDGMHLLAFSTYLHVEQRQQERRAMQQILFALKRYQIQHQKFPEQLTQLPADVQKLIRINTQGKPQIQYRSNGKGCILYTIGDDGIDQTFPPGATQPVLSDGFAGDDYYPLYTPDFEPVEPKQLETEKSEEAK